MWTGETATFTAEKLDRSSRIRMWHGDHPLVDALCGVSGMTESRSTHDDGLAQKGLGNVLVRMTRKGNSPATRWLTRERGTGRAFILGGRHTRNYLLQGDAVDEDGIGIRYLVGR